MSHRHRFRMGQPVITLAAQSTLERAGISPTVLLGRHLRGDWGELDIADIASNELARRREVDEADRVHRDHGSQRHPRDPEQDLTGEADLEDQQIDVGRVRLRVGDERPVGDVGGAGRRR